MRSTCKWEPFLGAAAQQARHAALCASRVPETMAAHACYTYTTGRGTQPPKRGIQGNLWAEQRGGDYHKILHNSNVSPFAVPFYDILMLTLPLGARIHSLARTSLQLHWTTSWGPGRIVNALLFAGKRIVPECQADLIKATSRSRFQTGKSVAILGTYLFFSPFGKRIMKTWPSPEPALLSDTACRLQRFFLQIV